MVVAMAATPRIGTMIRRARERKRMSQKDLAKALGVSRSAVNAWENDRAWPQNSIGALEQILGISLDGADAPHGELVAEDEWERSVLSDPDLPYEVKRALIVDSRAARAAYRGRSGSRGTGRTAGPRGTAAG